MSLLTISNLSIQFKSRDSIHTALEPINFEIKKASVCGIVGESGSGKSITSLTIMGLLPKSAIKYGSIVYHSSTGPIELLNLNEEAYRKFRGNKFAMIFQEPMTSLNPVIKCGKQVAEAIALHQDLTEEEIKSKVIALFEEVKLPRPEKIFDSYPHEISGGQKQRVMIAMALSSNPELLIADEPTTALDVTVQKTIIDLLKQIKENRGMSILFISHDLGLVSQIADEVLVMKQGKLIESNTSTQIFKHPKESYTKGLIACKPNIKNSLKRLATIADFEESALSPNEVLDRLKIDHQAYTSKREKLYNSNPILEIKNLSKYYQINTGLFSTSKEKVYAVNNVNLNLYKGESLGLVGESGCGKTTLGRSVLRLIEPNAGQIIYNGVDLLSLNSQTLRSYRSKIQIIFQDPYSSLNPKFTIGESLIEPMMVHGIAQSKTERMSKVMETLLNVGLKEEHYYRYPHEFSGGQRQRICIARTLVLEPELIICDESVSALDVSVQAQVLNLLSDLKDKYQLTYLFISHDLSVIKHFSDRIVVMKKGEIIEQGFPEEIYYHPKMEYTKELIASIPTWE